MKLERKPGWSASGAFSLWELTSAVDKHEVCAQIGALGLFAKPIMGGIVVHCQSLKDERTLFAWFTRQAD